GGRLRHDRHLLVVPPLYVRSARRVSRSLRLAWNERPRRAMIARDGRVGARETSGGPDLMNRRDLLRDAACALAGSTALAAGRSAAAEGAAVPKVAAVITEFTFRSHAHVILENFLNPYLFNGKVNDPGAEVVALYVDQFPARDLARQVAKERGIPI